MKGSWKGMVLIMLSLFIVSGCVEHPVIKQITEEFSKLGEQLSAMNDEQFNETMAEESKDIPEQVEVDGRSVQTKTLADQLSEMSKNFLTSDEISSEGERAIITESLVGGTAAGVAIGALAGQITGGNTKSTLTGAAIGGLVGALSGTVIGMDRVREIKDLRLENDKMKDFLNAADKTNNKIAEENTRLSEQIENLKEKSKEERMAIAQKELEVAKNKQKEVEKLMEDRKDIAEAFYSEQKEEYEQRIRTLEEEDKKLANIIGQLEATAETGRIG